jgi:hypothetical protein
MKESTILQAYKAKKRRFSACSLQIEIKKKPQLAAGARQYLPEWFVKILGFFGKAGR